MSSIPLEMITLPTQSKQCPVSITTVRKQDRLIISSVVDEHNHDVSPTKSRLIRKNIKLNMKVKRTIALKD